VADGRTGTPDQGVGRGVADAASAGLVADDVDEDPAAFVPVVSPIGLPPLLLVPVPAGAPVDPLVEVSVPDVEPVALVGAVVPVPVALPLVASFEWRLQADSIRAALVAAIRAVIRKMEVARMAYCSKG